MPALPTAPVLQSGLDTPFGDEGSRGCGKREAMLQWPSESFHRTRLWQLNKWAVVLKKELNSLELSCVANYRIDDLDAAFESIKVIGCLRFELLRKTQQRFTLRMYLALLSPREDQVNKMG